MSNSSRGFVASDEHERVGPDYFGYYVREVLNLLSYDEDFLPLSTQTSSQTQHASGRVSSNNTIQHSDNCFNQLYRNGIGATLSNFGKDRLRLLLKQGVTTLSSEVDEVLDPVLAMHDLQLRLRCKRLSPGNTAAASADDEVHAPCKKTKLSNSSFASGLEQVSDVNPQSKTKGSKEKHKISEPMGVALSEKREKPGIEKRSIPSKRKKSPTGEAGAAEPKGDDSQLSSRMRLEKENGEVDNDLLFLLENDSVQVEEIVKKYSDELSGKLGYMEQQLELLLDSVMMKCRAMTLVEKQQLKKLIEKLPPRNFDRVVEIIYRSKPLGRKPGKYIHVDLEKEDNATLWRLYYYIEAVENAKRLTCSQA